MAAAVWYANQICPLQMKNEDEKMDGRHIRQMYQRKGREREREIKCVWMLALVRVCEDGIVSWVL